MEKINRTIRAAIKKVMPGHFPDFMILGAQRCATTSLHYYLNQHPSLVGSRPKEVRFFDRDENYKKGLDWYSHNFPNTRNPFGHYLYFEATPEYLYRSYVPDRIHSFSDTMRFIAVLRNPAERAYSAWLVYRQFGLRRKLPEVMLTGHESGTENNIRKEFYSGTFPSFSEAVSEDIRKFEQGSPFEEPSIVRRGVYFDQLKRYADRFGKESLLTLGFRDLIGPKQQETLNVILRFVGLPESDWQFLRAEPRNRSIGKEQMDVATARQLESFYKVHNQKLVDWLGHQPNW